MSARQQLQHQQHHHQDQQQNPLRARLIRQRDVSSISSSSSSLIPHTQLSCLPDEENAISVELMSTRTLLNGEASLQADSVSGLHVETQNADDQQTARTSCDKATQDAQEKIQEQPHHQQAPPPSIDATIVLQEAPQLVTVTVRLLTLVCCSQKTVWVFRTNGLVQLGQAELLLVLERIPADTGIPSDVIRLFNGVLAEARLGDTVGDLDHTVFHSAVRFLGSAYIGGILYFMDSGGQCFHGLVGASEQCSLLLCRLVHSKEVPLLMYAPVRLMLRLGKDDGVYPCSVISSRVRPAVFQDITRSVYSLFREVLPHHQGMIPRLRDCQISLESSSVTVSLTRKRHAELLALLRLYAPDADGVLAFGGELCQFADAHLVAMETKEGGDGSGQDIETFVFKAKTATGKPTVIGASFIALSAHTPGGKGVGVPGSVAAVVEDGVAVTCRREEMRSLLQSLKYAADYTLTADWMFPIRRKKVHTKCPIRFVWRLKPGQ